MNFVILGNGDQELSWARWLYDQNDHRLAAVFPGFADPSFSAIPTASDLDGALAIAGIDAAIVGGPISERGESLRRAAAEGLAIICLHPAGDDSEAYYQVSLSRSETGAVIVPDLPLRLHPGVEAMRQVMDRGDLGASRGIRYEFPSHGEGTDLARVVFPRCVDVVRSLVGEIEALTATGDPPETRPDIELVVQLRAARSPESRGPYLVRPRRAGAAHGPGIARLDDTRSRHAARTTRPFRPTQCATNRRGHGTRPLGCPRRDLLGAGSVSVSATRHRFSQPESSRCHARHGAD